jgi:hypothetical protein
MNLQTLTYRREKLPTAWHSTEQNWLPEKRQFAMVDLELFNRPPKWQVKANEKLAHLQTLATGWGGPNTGPISAGMAAYIQSVLTSVMQPDTPVPSFVPAHGGAVQLEWHQGGLDIELMIYRPLEAELSVNFHNGREPIEEELLSVNFDRLSEVLIELV